MPAAASAAAAEPPRRAAATPRPAPAPTPAPPTPDAGGGRTAGRSGHDDRPDVVRVTIDRVEVRATIATPPAAPAVADAARREPSLSLHDYLSGRSR
jgi:hypothetical protein